MVLSYCVVNTNGREDLLACLDALEGHHPKGVEHEVLVLDNASEDGSAEAVRSEYGDRVRLFELEQRTGKAENDSTLLREARGRYCLLLNEDSELKAGAAAALLAAMEADPRAAAATAQHLSSEGRRKACAWRLPGAGPAAAVAMFLHGRLVVQSRGHAVREVGWAQSSALMVRRAAAQAVDYLDPAFFVYSDETDFCKRLRDAGWTVLYVPEALAVHHDQLGTDPEGMKRRIVEFHRARDRYMCKHHSDAARLAARALWVVAYLERALAAVALPGHEPGRYLLHAAQEMWPGRGEGIREAAERFNAANGAG